jgi:hypothetical protein
VEPPADARRHRATDVGVVEGEPDPSREDVSYRYAITSPEASAARQKLLEAHDTAVSGRPDPTGVGADQPPSWNSRARPALSTAAQKLVPTHEIETMVGGDPSGLAPSTGWGADHDDPFHESTLPALSPAMQNDPLVHDTDSNCP